jgi:hypothetical protein
MTGYLIAAGMAVVSFLSVKYALAERKHRKESDELLQAYMDGDKLRQQLAKKTEAIVNEQAEQKARVDSGGVAGSIDVLSKLSSRRRSKT